jgi:hypothetical protein
VRTTAVLAAGLIGGMAGGVVLLALIPACAVLSFALIGGATLIAGGMQIFSLWQLWRAAAQDE